MPRPAPPTAAIEPDAAPAMHERIPSPPLPRAAATAAAARPQGSSSVADAVRALSEGSREPLVPMELHVGDDPDPGEDFPTEPLVPRVLVVPGNDGPPIAPPRGSVGSEPLVPRELRVGP